MTRILCWLSSYGYGRTLIRRSTTSTATRTGLRRLRPNSNVERPLHCVCEGRSWPQVRVRGGARKLPFGAISLPAKISSGGPRRYPVSASSCRPLAISFGYAERHESLQLVTPTTFTHRGAREVNELNNLISAATAAVEHIYFRLPIAGQIPAYRERVYWQL